MKFSSLSSIAAVLLFLPAALSQSYPAYFCALGDVDCWNQWTEEYVAWAAPLGADYVKKAAECTAMQPPGSTEAQACFLSLSTLWLKANNDTVVEDADVTPPTDPSEEDVNLEDDESSSSMLRSTTSIAAAAISMVAAATVLVLA